MTQRQTTQGRGSDSLRGRRIFLVEDDYFIANDFAAALEDAGAEVVGPVATLQDALDLLARTDHLDGAALDINLQGELVYALADVLRARGVPIVFASGYDRSNIPERYAHIPLCEKPMEPERCAAAMFA